MSIRFNSAYNGDIRKIVQNFNRRVQRMEQSGFKHVPDLIKVSELKARYSSRNELNKELKRLKFFNREDILKTVENKGGTKSVKWEYTFLKNNLKSAQEYFQKEYDRVSAKLGKYPGERTYLDTIAAKIENLQRDINYMNQREFKMAMSAVKEFAMSPAKRQAQYRGFLNEVEWAMHKLSISDDKINTFFKKFEELTPSQFLYVYNENPLIRRIYELYIKTDEVSRFNTSDENANLYINMLMEQADDMIKDAKTNMN